MGLIGKEKLIEQISIRLQRLNSAELRSVNAIVSRFLHNKNKRDQAIQRKRTFVKREKVEYTYEKRE